MSRGLTLSALWVALCVAGFVACSKPPTPDPAVAGEDATPTRLDPRFYKHPFEPFDWVKQPPVIEKTPPAEIKFASDHLNQTIARWERAAGAMHATDWFHQSWYLAYRHPNLPCVIEWWSNTPEAMSLEGERPKTGANSDRDVQIVRIRRAQVVDDPLRAWAEINATWARTKGWNAELVANMGPDGVTFASLFIYPLGLPPLSTVHIGLPLISSWRYNPMFDDVNYSFEVEVKPSSEAERIEKARLIHAEMLRWSQSPESLKESALSILKELEQAIRAEIASGAALKEASVFVELPSGNGEPPLPGSRKVDRKPTDEQIQSVLRDALQEIEHRREVIERYHVEIHEAIQKVFPVQEIMGEAPQ